MPIRAHVGTFRTSDGVDLRYTRRGRGHRRAILVLPSLFTHRESREHRLLAGRLLDLADVVTLDVRGHGDSGGSFTWGMREPGEVAGLVATLRASYERVGGIGFSFGGYHVGAAAAQHRVFDAVSMIATPRSLLVFDRNFLVHGIARTIRAALRRRRGLTRCSLAHVAHRPAAANLVAGIAPAPVLIAHGTRDWLVNPIHAHSLYERAAEPKTLLLIDGAMHAEGILTERPERLLGPLSAFFDQHL